MGLKDEIEQLKFQLQMKQSSNGCHATAINWNSFYKSTSSCQYNGARPVDPNSFSCWNTGLYNCNQYGPITTFSIPSWKQSRTIILQLLRMPQSSLKTINSLLPLMPA